MAVLRTTVLRDRNESLVECWTLDDAPKRTTIKPSKEASTITLSPDGTILAVGHCDGTIGLYRTDTGKCDASVLPMDRFTVSTLAFHTNGKLLLGTTTASKGLKNLCLVELATGKTLAAVSVDPGGVQAACFSASGDRIATYGMNGVLQIWDVKNTP